MGNSSSLYPQGKQTVHSKYVNGVLKFYNSSNQEIYSIDPVNRTVTIPSGATFSIASGATADISDEALAAADIALAQGSILVGDAGGAASAVSAKADTAIMIGNGTTIVAKTVSGDASLANTGALTIGAKAVTNTKIAAAAGTVLAGTKTSGDVTCVDISAAGAMLIGQGAGETAAAKTISGNVVVASTGVATIQAGVVTNAMLASGAGVGAILTAGLGASASYLKTKNDTTDLLAAGAKAQAVIGIVVVDETFADVGGNQPTFSVGEESGAVDKFMVTGSLTGKAAGTVLAFAGTQTIAKKVQVTGVKAVGAGTGGISVTILAIPTS